MEDTHVAHSPRKRVKLEHHPLQLENTKMSSTLESGSHQEDEIYHDPPEYVVSQEKVIEQPNANETRLAKEEECGILEFVKPSPTHPGFSGIMKKRYTDFLVNEITPSGEVLHLTELKPSSEVDRLLKTKDEIWKQRSSENFDNSSSPAKTLTEDRVDTVKMDSSLDGKPSILISSDISTSQNLAKPTNQAAIANTSSIESGVGSTPKSDYAATSHDPLPKPTDSPVLDNVSPHDVFPSNFDDIQDPWAHHFMLAPPLPPHKRVIATKQNIPTNPISENEWPDEEERRKYTDYIRFSGSGCIQVTEEKEDSEKLQPEKKAAEQRADDELEEAASKEEQPAPPSVNYYQPAPSSIGSWSTFARSNSEISPKNRKEYSAKKEQPASPPVNNSQPTPNIVDSGNMSARSDSEILPEDRGFLEQWLSKGTIEAILSLYKRIVDSPSSPVRNLSVVETAVFERNTRRQIHEGIRRIFKSKLESSTNKAGGLVISPMSKQSNSRKTTFTTASATEMRGKSRWAKLGGEYLHFSLYKENKDTMEVIAFLARQLRIKPKDIAFAGTKDRRGVTVQRLSLHYVGLDRVLGAQKYLRDAYVGNFERQQNGLRLGELKGNEFVITLRECDFYYSPTTSNADIRKGAERIVRESLQSLAENGFINYFGLQRFGSHDIGTHSIGISILQGKFLIAVEQILYYRPACRKPELEGNQDSDAISQDDRARAEGIHAFLIQENPDLALSRIPKRFTAEINIVRFLSKPGQQNDYLGALMSIPRNQRLMYIHAYQSLVWNHVASRRWNWFGHHVVPGDLVLINKHEDEIEENTERTDADGEIIVEPEEDDNLDEKFTRARPLTATEAYSGKYTIFDVVLPTPGYDIIYPKNAFGEHYRKFMFSKAGGELDLNNMRRKEREFSLSGSYRKLIARPENTSFEIREYEAEDEQFVETDLEKYKKAHHLPPPPPPKPAQRTAEAKRIAVILKMQLGPGQYATMALRELMKKGGVKTGGH